ncbi:hypothetical protein N9W89_04090 [Hellea sp.]|nr:hypothetical protein [Hellea sp.]
MTKLTKTLSAAVILASIGFGSAANAQTVQMPSAAVAPTHSWALKDTAAGAHTPLQNYSAEQTSQDNQFTPWTNKNPDFTSKINTKTYSKFNVKDFKYPVLGPVNFAVQEDYSDVFISNNTSNAGNVVYQAPDNGVYNQNSYQLATTATAQVKLRF